ncbi:hypothetical protein AAVH_06079 [Aphelenchoides avenae]|nr:hypothetical protein AAVH_06079 [Aphelenchus avenae]
MFVNRYTMEEPAYAKLATEGIPPPICIFPYRPNIRGPDNDAQRGGWRGGGGRHRQYGNRPERNDRQGGSGGGGWRNDRRDDWNSGSRRGGPQRSRSPPRRNY